MLAKRIIPCLDVHDGKTVKGVNFVRMVNVGDPVELARAYSYDGADELVFLDISATLEGRRTFLGLVKKIARNIDIPFTVGGGISSMDDAARLLDAGADKVSICTAIVNNPQLISDLAKRYGSQFVVAAIDAKQVNGIWRVTTNAGTKYSNKEMFSWAKEAEDRGAGEILFTSMDNDGTEFGYACEPCRKLADLVHVPVIASGGAGSIQDIEDVLTKGGADAAMAAGVFHYGKIRIPRLKKHLREDGITVRYIYGIDNYGEE